MENFEFYNPTRIIFGKEAEKKIGKILEKDDVERVLFVYGKSSIKETGLYDRIVKALKKEGIEFIEHGGVKPNPVLSHTREGIEKAKKHKVDAILAVGGGSVIDEGKTIAVGTKTDKDVWDFFKRNKEIKKALPIYVILTLAATGSEMNGFAVITNEETQEKLSISSEHIFPRVSILNPELTFTVSAKYQAYAAVDAIAHVIEHYFSGSYCPNLQNRFVEGLIKTVMETTEIILKEQKNYNARAEFMWAATLALNGLAKLGIKGGSFPNHMIAHSLGAIYDLPHGACLSIVIPAWMKWYQEKNLIQFERFAKEIFGVNTATEGVFQLKEWFRKIGAPVSLKEAGISIGEIDRIVDNAYNIAKVWQMEKDYTKEVLTEIIKNAND
ncbi:MULTISPECIES: iron-containing alcohol dehydrogenase [Thermodesulfovibrio]|jgi:alcohol dehydrogenase YqhD (iron-dependent ADH family)|uniref:NADH-dependent butanol dehydrogenase a n=1 Tax=Thermodesulfovibrio yellowstonii (strain ATCC 51303 / DSM 11347 / YP87) TaxID=289376 RepID=B5YIE2_THEYD|nr:MULTISPECIES: iron-containing alcohol dehydrogenase [Thermodesulfovibrio]ACI21161.1 NADH-dependent butanol dehydrogenase a [Thermodesulfovibrio yellowstonii DSM 11347]